MSYLASATQFNLGIDRTIQMVDALGNTYTFSSNPINSNVLGRLIDFTSKPDTDQVENPGIGDGGMVETMIEHKTWSGTITCDRRTGNLDTFWATLEAAYHAGGAQTKFTIHELTQNRDQLGTISKFRYNNAAVWLEEAGNWQLGQRPEMKLGFKCTTRVPE